MSHVAFFHTTDHRILGVSLHVYIGVSRGPQGSLTLVSVTTKHTLLHWACNRHLPMVGLSNATGQAGDFFHLRQGLLPGHSGMEGASSRIIFESSGSLKQEQRPFFVFWYLYCGNYYLNGTPALRSFIYVTWVNQLLTLVQ